MVQPSFQTLDDLCQQRGAFREDILAGMFGHLTRNAREKERVDRRRGAMDRKKRLDECLDSAEKNPPSSLQSSSSSIDAVCGDGDLAASLDFGLDEDLAHIRDALRSLWRERARGVRSEESRRVFTGRKGRERRSSTPAGGTGSPIRAAISPALPNEISSPRQPSSMRQAVLRSSLHRRPPPPDRRRGTSTPKLCR